MSLTEGQLSHLAHRALDAFKRAGGQVRNERLALAEAKNVLQSSLDRDPRIDGDVRRRILSQQRRPPEGSAEWDVLYRQYYEQERARRRP